MTESIKDQILEVVLRYGTGEYYQRRLCLVYAIRK